jgi:transposase
MQPYSQDLRLRIVKARTAGEGSVRTPARRFAVSPFFVQQLLTKFRTTGSIQPKRHERRGPVGKRTPQALEHTRLPVQEDTDATLAEPCERLAERHGMALCVPSMCRALRQIDMPRKKGPARQRTRQ